MITCTAVLCVFLKHGVVKEKLCAALGRVVSSQCCTEYNIIAWRLAPLLQLINTLKYLFHYSLLQRNEAWSVLSEEPGCNWVIYFASRGISPLINEMSKAAKSCKDHTLRVINHEQTVKHFEIKKVGLGQKVESDNKETFVSLVFKEVFFSFNSNCTR